MKTIFKLALLIAVMLSLFGTGLVSYSADIICPGTEPPPKVNEPAFFSAHGITQGNYSLWLKEHSVWRRTYSDELKDYSFIPQDYDKDRE